MQRLCVEGEEEELEDADVPVASVIFGCLVSAAVSLSMLFLFATSLLTSCETTAAIAPNPGASESSPASTILEKSTSVAARSGAQVALPARPSETYRSTARDPHRPMN